MSLLGSGGRSSGCSTTLSCTGDAQLRAGAKDEPKSDTKNKCRNTAIVRLAEQQEISSISYSPKT